VYQVPDGQVAHADEAVIYLVRHGESEWNVAQRTQGQTPHPGLTEHGRAQSRAAARALLADIGSTPVSRVVSSDLVRAIQTAEIIAAMLGARMCVDARLREQWLGSFEGLSYAESFAAGSAFDWSDPDLRVGGGESLREMATRMTTALSDFVDELISPCAIVVVSHGDAIRALLAARVGALPGGGPWVDVPNGSVAVLNGTNGARWLAVDLPVNGR
jgi:2,3-bisphosphoglycerate-dependent phosphoglycerate mutase